MNTDANIKSFLLKCGFRPHLAGFKAWVHALKLCKQNPEYLENLTSWLYPDCANYLNISWTNVERVMRYSLARAYDCNPDLPDILGFLPELSGSCNYKVGEFLARAVDLI